MHGYTQPLWNAYLQLTTLAAVTVRSGLVIPNYGIPLLLTRLLHLQVFQTSEEYIFCQEGISES